MGLIHLLGRDSAQGISRFEEDVNDPGYPGLLALPLEPAAVRAFCLAETTPHSSISLPSFEMPWSPALPGYLAV